MHFIKSKLTLERRQSLTGWTFLAPAAILICLMNFYQMIQALVLSFKSGIGNNLEWAGLYNYQRLFSDSVFRTALFNTFLYLIIQVPIMLSHALLLASLLNMNGLR